MKKVLVFLTLAVLIASCTKTEDEIGSSTDKSGSESYLGVYGDSGSGGVGSGGSDGNGNSGEDSIQSGQITAGEWNDLANWNFWSDLSQKDDFKGMSTYWTYNLNSRISVKLTNSTLIALTDMKVELLDSNDKVLWTCKTDNSGSAELFPGLGKYTSLAVEDMKIKINNTIFENLQSYSKGVNNLTLDLNPQVSRKADIAFVVDATGSMGDELEYLKVELIDVIGRVKTANPSTIINLGSVFYRDTEDAYLTRVSGFSSNTNQTIEFIRNQSASGGGDFPEAVHTALHKAVNELQWSSSAITRIIFLVLDAPPHYEPQIIKDIHAEILNASTKGIRIIPVTASGIDKETEFLMRYMAIATNGSYVFITNHSGIGGEHLEPTIGEYEVELLNKLIERIINKYLK